MLLPLSADDIAHTRTILAGIDPALGRAQAQTPALEWRSAVGGYEGLLRMILGQQVSVASADATWRRTVVGLGGSVTPEAVLACDLDTLRGFGLSRQKALYAQEIARAQTEGRIDFDHLEGLSDDQAVAALVALKGVGRWTAETFLMFCEARTDIFPGGDIALQEAIRWADGLDYRPDAKQAHRRAELWAPHRSVAAHLLWGWYGGVRRGEIRLEPTDF